MAEHSLSRRLGLVAVVFYCFGDILGAGIYSVVGEVAGRAGTSAPLAFALSLLVAAMTAVSYSELATRHPRSGAEVLFVERVFCRAGFALFIGYLVLASAIVSSATVSHAFAGYLDRLRPGVPEAAWIALFLVAAAAVNLRGIEWSSTTNIVFTVVEASGLLVVLGVGAAYLFGTAAPEVRSVMPTETAGWVGVAQGGALAFFAFIGFEDVVNVAEEVRSPRRNLPRAIGLALLLAALLYLSVTWVAVQVLDPEQLASSSTPLVDVVAISAPWFPLAIFALIAAFAVANTGLLNGITASRLLYGTARRGLLPAWLGRVSPTRRTPHWAIAVVLGAQMVLAFSGTLAYLAGTTAVLLLLVFSTIHVGLVVAKLRDRRLGVSPPDEVFRAPLVVPFLGVASCVLLLRWVPAESVWRALVVVLVCAALAWLGRASGPSMGRDGAPGDDSATR